MLKLENVRKRYKDFELNCSLEVPEGYVTGLVGANGAGKSTAFKAALGLIRADGGQIGIFGKEPEKLTRSDKEQIGVVLADSGFSGYLCIKDLILILDSLYTNFEREAFVERCEHFKLPLDKKLKDFSTGMKRKLHILAAISHDARLLILDEPTAGLDVVAREEILGMLREYMEQDGRSILISSHISSDLEGFCDDIYMIDSGEVIMHEEVDTLLSEYAILKVTKEQYEALDKSYILRCSREDYGYNCLTDQRRFYQENYPQIEIEKGCIDDVIMIMIRGEKV